MDNGTSFEDGWRAFIKLCLAIKNEEELRELFDLFFTLEEKEGLSKRFLIIKCLVEEKLTQREISERTGVSISKITRGSNALKIISRRLREALKQNMT